MAGAVAGADTGADTGAVAGTGTGTRPLRRVLVLGAGGRVCTDVLPALASLPDHYRVDGVFARSRRALEVGGQTIQTRDFRSLRDEDLAAADLVYVAVSKGAVPAVLQRLAQHPHEHLDLLLDTPVLLFKHFGHAQLLESYRNVWVAEDCVHLPWLEVVERAAADWMGMPTTVDFERSAYRYHGFALLKQLFDGAPVRSARRRRIPGGQRLELQFEGGACGVLVEPRDYATGHWTIRGPGGGITDGPEVGDDLRRLEFVAEDTRALGFQLGGTRHLLRAGEAELLGPLEPGDTPTSRTDDLKRVGLARLLLGVAEGRGAWPLWEGLDDMVIDWSLEKAGRYRATRWTSVKHPTGRALLGGALRMVSKG